MFKTGLVQFILLCDHREEQPGRHCVSGGKQRSVSQMIPKHENSFCSAELQDEKCSATAEAGRLLTDVTDGRALQRPLAHVIVRCAPSIMSSLNSSK